EGVGTGVGVGSTLLTAPVTAPTGPVAEPSAGAVPANAVPPSDRQSSSAPLDTVATRRLVEVWVISRPSAGPRGDQRAGERKVTPRSGLPDPQRLAPLCPL